MTREEERLVIDLLGMVVGLLGVLVVAQGDLSEDQRATITAQVRSVSERWKVLQEKTT